MKRWHGGLKRKTCVREWRIKYRCRNNGNREGRLNDNRAERRQARRKGCR